MATSLTRKVQRRSGIDTPDIEMGSEPLSFESHLESPNIILLGDPGAGKSHLFKEAAEFENAKLSTARQFLIYGADDFKGDTLYIDALDESRARRSGSGSLESVVQRIVGASPAKLRLACRAADWYGDTDLELLKPYFEKSGGYTVLSLLPLTDEEVGELLRSMGINQPIQFQANARSRGVESLLRNPQTLILLCAAVQDGNWPDSKYLLYESAISQLLSEHNQNRAKEGLTAHPVEELLDAAGAACASVLVSDVAGLSLESSGDDPETPRYSLVPHANSDLVLSALVRKAFSSIGDSVVTYSHRTIAEYLAAKWIAKQVREGYPIGRVRALTCIDGKPATELRGLHAWLAVHVDHPGDLIDADPYGVLVYSDVSRLDLTARRRLLNALEKLSEESPWFRGDDWSTQSIGALCGPDLVEDFCRILDSANSSFHLRSIVFEALRFGQPLPELFPRLMELLCNTNASYSDRVDALMVIINHSEELTKEVVVEVYPTLGASESELRLRKLMLTELYGDAFGPEHVVALLDLYLMSSKSESNTGLWFLHDDLPLDDMQPILDLLVDKYLDENSEDDDGISDGRREVGNCFDDILLRRLTENPLEPNPKVLWKWLLTRSRLRDEYSGARNKDQLRVWLSARPAMLIEMFDHAEGLAPKPEKLWQFWHEFQKLTLFSLPNDALAISLFKTMTSLNHFDEAGCARFELALMLTVRSDPPETELFESLMMVSENHTELHEISNRLCFCELEEWRSEQLSRALAREAKDEELKQETSEVIEKNIETIRAGANLSLLGYLARIYFGAQDQQLRALEPKNRLVKRLGADHASVACDGFIKLAQDDGQAPEITDITELNLNNQYFPWWQAIVAGIDEIWQESGELSRVPKRCREFQNDASLPVLHLLKLCQFFFAAGVSRRSMNANG